MALAISSYRNDDAVLNLLAQAHALGAPPFAVILVVDSQGSGRFPAALREAGFASVEYYCSPENLGSAGNLAERLARAADHGVDYIYALNHDGQLDLDHVARLVECAQGVARVGAVYPLRQYDERGGEFEDVGGYAVPLVMATSARPPGQEVRDVRWASSNGALYSAEPVRRGLLPWADLWMGWEDLGYGWLLYHHGYRQVLLSSVVFRDNYEYSRRRLLGLELFISNKPAWYNYYAIRNLILIVRRLPTPLSFHFFLAVRALRDALVIALFKDQKITRYRLMLEGLIDGLRGRAGKGRVP